MPGETDYAPPVDEIVTLIPALRAFARTWRRHPPDVDALVEQTLRHALDNPEDYDPGCGVRAWLLSIMRRASSQPYRPGVEADGDPQHRRQRTERQRRIAEAVDALPEPLREVVILVEVLRLPHGEAAAICGCSTATLRDRLAQAERQLVEQSGSGLSEVQAGE